MLFRIGAIVLAILSLTAISAKGSQSPNAGEATKPPEVQARGPNIGTAITYNFEEQYEIQVKEYLDVNFYLTVVVPEQQAVEAYLWAIAHPPPPPQARAVVRSSSGSCCGPHSDQWWRGVAQCEQSGRNDPYFGYFSWMDGSAAGMTWEQQVAKSNDLLSRVSSESPAWAPSCVAMGYQYSPSG